MNDYWFLRGCACGGPFVLPDDVLEIRPNVIVTARPESIRYLHEPRCTEDTSKVRKCFQ